MQHHPTATLAAITAGTLILGLVCAAESLKSPAGHTAPRVAVPRVAGQSTQAVVQAATHARIDNVSSLNLRLPRAPRHRCERQSSGADEVEAITSVVVLGHVVPELRRSHVPEASHPGPLAGHPLSILRPPSRLDG